MAKKRGIEIVVSQDVATVLGMEPSEVSEKIVAVLKKHKIAKRCYLSLLMEDGKALVCTTMYVIECDKTLDNSVVRQPNVGFTVGRNRTGHKLPASCSGW